MFNKLHRRHFCLVVRSWEYCTQGIARSFEYEASEKVICKTLLKHLHSTFVWVRIVSKIPVRQQLIPPTRMASLLQSECICHNFIYFDFIVVNIFHSLEIYFITILSNSKLNLRENTESNSIAKVVIVFNNVIQNRKNHFCISENFTIEIEHTILSDKI